MIVGATTETHAQVIYRLNCGGPDYVDPSGNLWSSDNGSGLFNVGKTLPSPLSPMIDIAGTDLDVLYRTERYDPIEAPNMLYSFPVTPGYYLVKLHFAEIYWNKPNRRKFDVVIHGEPVLVNYDIADGLGAYAADVRQFVTEVVAGELEIEFLHADPILDNPKISAIEIEKISNAPVITVVSPPRLQIAPDSRCSTPQNRVSLTAVDPDTDGSGMKWTLRRAPKFGTAAFVAGISNGTEVAVCYTPRAGQVSDDSFVVRVDDLDPNGGVAEVTILVSLVDSIAPDITCPENAIVYDGDSIEPNRTGQPIVSDAFDSAPMVSYSDESEPRDCPEVARIRRQWTAVDASGNIAICTQTIKVFSADSDDDGTPDCEDACPADEYKIEPGSCGCGKDDADRNADGQPDCTPTRPGRPVGDPSDGDGVGNPPADECCGGGIGIVTPFMMLGFPRRRTRRRK